MHDCHASVLVGQPHQSALKPHYAVHRCLEVDLIADSQHAWP
ncbi:hypothetical protein [Kitasatospora cystarginea]